MEKASVLQLDKMTLGVCYYPEHWKEELWEQDLARMLQSGLRVIRIAEFAWNFFEPEEGVFTFEFFDRFMQVVEKTPMKVIFCTPTATPPAWASDRYPEILNARKDGVLYRHGLRRHYNYNSEKYRQLTRDIVSALARHYGQHPSIIGWQIDNELNCEVNEFYSESDSVCFRTFLKEKYGSIERLNEAWGTAFWNQSYNDFEQVHVPRTTLNEEGNPHQKLDYLRFISESTCRYTGLQAKILRAHIPAGVFITTNGLFGNVDNHRQAAENLDFMMYDSYPSFAFSPGSDPKNDPNLADRKWSQNLSETRSVSPVFGVMEQQSGAGGWTSWLGSPSPKPGQMTLWALQSVAHGADYVSFFRWRTCTFGTEIYWHGILDYDNRDNRRLREAAQIAGKLEKLAPVTGARYKAAFAVIREYDNLFDAQYDAWHRLVHETSEAGWFQAAQLTHTPMDYLYITEHTKTEELLRYPLLVYPHATLLSERTAGLLESYVKAGGRLITGCRTGYKDENGHCIMQPKPGLLRELCGAEVEDFTLIGPPVGRSFADWDGEQVEATAFNDILSPLPGAEVLARYCQDYYAGQPALIHNRCGRGEVFSFGGAFSRETAMVFLRRLGIAEPFAGLVCLPPECELAVREKEGERYLFLLNYQSRPIEVLLRREMEELLSGGYKEGAQKLPPYGVWVLRAGQD
ncbi:MAG: beta-galactosidase [Provencibacterium sp.]|jgi:beta-galactosidase|nr:beta-galactosidase [Provencibacterium sp.]